MNELDKLFDTMLNENLKQIVLSDSLDKMQAIKSKIRPVAIKNQLLFQETLYRGTQVFHQNYTKEEMQQRIIEQLQGLFRQAQFDSAVGTASVLVSKKGKMTVKCKLEKGKTVKETSLEQLSHNREKQYILKEGMTVDFLVGLGVQTPDGKINKTKYDKFRQINRYLEFIEDVLEELPKDRTIRIVDFGCGKSYLTFAMYYYLHELQGRDVEVTGLDLKVDVIDHCNQLAEKCGYDHLHFEKGDIATYTGAEHVDMVVSLHACDTATDFALEKAIGWNASVIMAVPCCQHEVNQQIRSQQLRPLLRYGLIKERMSALITDALRANLLEQQGYDTQILEFIDMEHTPKNLLIRGVKRSGMQSKGQAKEAAANKSQTASLMEALEISPTLAKLLQEKA